MSYGHPNMRPFGLSNSVLQYRTAASAAAAAAMVVATTVVIAAAM